MEELITHQKEGWIVPVYDEEAMARQILEFSLLDLEYIKNIKHAALLKIEQQHTESKMIEDMMSLYKSVYGIN
jgi:colanic acid/amylovoran biosynthesis glycosyltransferase